MVVKMMIVIKTKFCVWFVWIQKSVIFHASSDLALTNILCIFQNLSLHMECWNRKSSQWFHRTSWT